MPSLHDTVTLRPMGQKKLSLCEEITVLLKVLQVPQRMGGKCNTFFKNQNWSTLELACGKGEYAVGMGELFPQRNFIGIDLKGIRIWVGANKALQKKLAN